MPVDPGAGSEFSSRNFHDFFHRWGARANLRSVFNFVVPVSIVDRFRDQDEGSLYALWAQTPGFLNWHPAVAFGTLSETSDIEILGFQAWYSFSINISVPFNWTAFFHVFTPIAPYNPVATPAPGGVWLPGLVTNRNFVRGTPFALTGVNPNMPAYPGWPGLVVSNATRSAPTGSQNHWYPLMDQAGWTSLERPIRVHGNETLAFQAENPVAGQYLGLAVTILYRERVNYR